MDSVERTRGHFEVDSETGNCRYKWNRPYVVKRNKGAKPKHLGRGDRDTDQALRQEDQGIEFESTKGNDDSG